MQIIQAFVDHINFIGAVALFLIGLHTVVTKKNLIKRIMGLNIMGTSIFLFLVAIGNVTSGVPPILQQDPNVTYINPIPSVLILTGIVVVVSMTVYSLSLTIKIYEMYGTINQDELTHLIREEEIHD